MRTPVIKSNERPLRFTLDDETHDIASVEDTEANTLVRNGA